MKLKDIAQVLLDRAQDIAPKALLVLVLLLVGMLVSALAGRIVRWGVRRMGLEALAEKAGISPLLYVIGVRKGLGSLLGSLTKLTGILITLAAVADVLELSAVSSLTALGVQLLPRLLLAGTVLLGGLSLASLVRRMVERVAKESGDVESPGFAAHAAYWVIVVISITWSVEQAGLSTDIISSLTKLVFGLGLGAVALAFGLGFRPAMNQIVARHYYERMLSPGDRVRVGEHEGIVVRFSPVAVVIETAEGQVIVPANKLMDSMVSVQPLSEPMAVSSPSDRPSEPSERG